MLVVGTCLAACGGGGSSSSVSSTDPDIATRYAAAKTTAETRSECTSVAPFYWEVGDASGVLASGSVAASGGSAAYQSTTRMSIASASKWLYGAYYAQRVRAAGGTLTDEDWKYLRFLSGYTDFTECDRSDTVGSCASRTGYVAANDGKFYYSGGHMEEHAALHGLAGMDDAALATEIKSQIGTDLDLTYTQPQLAGGAYMSAAEYGKVLRRMMSGELVMGSLLGTNAVCASEATCPSQVVNSPAPAGEAWHYSLGHWVEDATSGSLSDGAFSSPGLFGFYPWIDKTKSWYGIVARFDLLGAYGSVYCGRLIRKAWVDKAVPP